MHLIQHPYTEFDYYILLVKPSGASLALTAAAAAAVAKATPLELILCIVILKEHEIEEKHNTKYGRLDLDV